MTEIRQCRAAEIFSDPRSAELIREYAEECAIALIGKPAPRRDMYENLEASGMGQCFAAYSDGQLEGFAMVLVAVVPHYELSLANVESMFVRRGARGVGLGVSLMRAVDDYAAELGCKAIFYCAPAGSRLAKRLFLCADQYTNTNHVFSKRLN